MFRTIGKWLVGLFSVLTVCPLSAALLLAPEVSLDLPKTHVCIHFTTLPGAYGAELCFAYGGDLSTNRLHALIEALLIQDRLSLPEDSIERAVREYAGEHLTHALNHPRFEFGYLDVTGLQAAIFHQKMLVRSRIMAIQQFEIDGRPLRIYWMEDAVGHVEPQCLGLTVGNNIFINLKSLHCHADGSLQELKARILSVLHHEQAHWLTARELRSGMEDPHLARFASQCLPSGRPHYRVLGELGSALASIARSTSARGEVLFLITSHILSRPAFVSDNTWSSDGPGVNAQMCLVLLLNQFMQQQGFESFRIERSTDRFRKLNGHDPGVLDQLWIREEAQFAVVFDRRYCEARLAFINTLDDHRIKSWARQTYEEHFGELVNLPDDIPPEVLTWFKSEGSTELTGIGMAD